MHDNKLKEGIIIEKLMYLLDLERTIGSGFTWYWKANRRGYTTDLYEAGLYSEFIAKGIVDSDSDKSTIMISKELIDNILKK